MLSKVLLNRLYMLAGEDEDGPAPGRDESGPHTH